MKDSVYKTYDELPLMLSVPQVADVLGIGRTSVNVYAYTTVNKTYILLGEYFKYLTQEEYIYRNPMLNVPMIKKNNFMAAQQKENLPANETVTVFTPEEIEKFKAETFRCCGT